MNCDEEIMSLPKQRDQHLAPLYIAEASHNEVVVVGWKIHSRNLAVDLGYNVASPNARPISAGSWYYAADIDSSVSRQPE